MGQQPFVRNLFGKMQVAPGVGTGCIQRQVPAHAVVPVRVAYAAVGVDAEDDIRAVAADFPNDLAPGLQAVLQGAVGVGQEHHVLDAQQGRGVPLLLLPDGCQVFGDHFPVGSALVPVGAHQDNDLGPRLFDPLGYRGAASALGVIRMGCDHQHAPRWIGDYLH